MIKILQTLWQRVNGWRSPHYHESVQGGHKVVICIGREVPASKELLKLFSSRISEIWPGLFSTMETEFEESGHSEEFPPAMFIVDVSRMDPECYMGDKSSFFLRFEFEREKFSDTLPFYDFFLDGDLKTVHHQPVF